MNVRVPSAALDVTFVTSPPNVCACTVARMPLVDQVMSAVELPIVMASWSEMSMSLARARTVMSLASPNVESALSIST